jgi:4-amino-4-deoxy-L-arabinose transferase-like glycosyltransferase
MSKIDKLAFLISILAVVAALLVATFIFERMAHIEDEMAFVWQAQVLARGNLTLPSPEHPKSYMVPFVIDHNGQRFGKYPLGWPVLMSFGIRLGLRYLVNPLLAGVAVWLTYLLGKRVWNETVGILAALLTLISPFFLMNMGSLLSHPFSLVLSLAFTLFWIDNFWPPSRPRWHKTLTLGLVLGTLAITRPFTAVGISIPFAIHSIVLLIRGDSAFRKHVLVTGAITAVVASLQFAWQAAASGDPLTNLYTLWWEYDQVGFGEGFGRSSNGHTLRLASIIWTKSLIALSSDLFGWGRFSWIFLPFGLWAIRRNGRAWLVVSVFITLVLVHGAYWISMNLYGPRYYFEGLYSLTLLTAGGIAWLGGRYWVDGKLPKFQKARTLIITGIMAILLATNLILYLPNRLKAMYGLYGIQRSMLDSFLTEEAQSLAPALIIVYPDWWTEYGGLLELQDAYLDQPIIFAYNRNYSSNALLAESVRESGRNVYHYYPGLPGKFYAEPWLPP